MDSKKSPEKKFDLNKKIMANEKTRKFARTVFFSRFLLTAGVIILQLGLILFFLFRFTSQLKYYLAASVILSAVFLIYMANSQGKNEYKIAWIAPVMIFPLVGIACYFLYHIDAGARKLKQDVKTVDDEIKKIVSQKSTDFELLENYYQIKPLCNYLYNFGNYCPHEKSLVKYYATGEDFLEPFLQSLRNAKKYIFIEFFIIRIEEVWDKILQILIQKISEGVEVRVICDGFGTYMVSASEYQKYLKGLGIKSKVFNPLRPVVSTPINNRDHRKIVVIDGVCGFTGGLNISNEYFNIGKNKFSYWKDSGVKIEGAAVFNLLQMFLEIWNIDEKSKDDFEKLLCTKNVVQQDDGLVLPYGDHAFNDEDIAENVYLEIINNAKNYLYITTPYVVIDNEILSALIRAAKRGVDVRLVVPGVPDHLITFCVGKTFLKNLIDGGVKVFIYKKGFIHAKTFLADGELATVGSVNLDYRSFYAHFECGVVLYKNSAISDIKKDFDSMFEIDCEEMKSENYKQLPALQKLIGRLLRIFGPLM